MKRQELGSRPMPLHGPDLVGWREKATSDNWLVLDTETTGLEADRELVEVAVIGADGKLVFDSLLHPSRLPSASARRVHGLNDESLARAPDPACILPELRSLLQGRLVYAFGATFDRKTLHLAFERHGLEPAECRWSCVLDMYVQVRGFSASLRTACEIEAIVVPGGPHRASIDADLTWRLLMRLRAA